MCGGSNAVTCVVAVVADVCVVASTPQFARGGANGVVIVSIIFSIVFSIIFSITQPMSQHVSATTCTICTGQLSTLAELAKMLHAKAQVVLCGVHVVWCRVVSTHVV